MKTNRKFLALIVGIPLAIWIVGFCLTIFNVTGNLITPLTKDVLDVWFVAAALFCITRVVQWINKGKKQVK